MPSPTDRPPDRLTDSVGTLYIVATPLGNLADLTARAAEVLRTAAVVAAEDTRRSRVLLNHLGAKPRVISFHAHSKPQRTDDVIGALRRGEDVALVTDAGTPGISDPGAKLVRAVRIANIPIVPVPGPSAVATALSASGLGADRFLFAGFPPRRGTSRRELLERVAESPWTVVLYESAPRLVTLLSDLETRCDADREVVVARELTKAYEEIRAGTLPQLRVYYEEHPPRGEVTVLVAGRQRSAPPDMGSAADRGRELLAEGRSRRDAAALLARELHISRNEAYRVVSEL